MAGVAAGGKQVLLLWDVDQTLIENSEVTRAVYARAFRLLTGHPPRVQPGTDGRTDPEIVRNLFAANDAEFTAADQAGYQQALIEAMAELHPQFIRDGAPLPGVLAALTAVSRIPGVVQSVLTGNIRPNAEAKLALLGEHAAVLDLDVGGYGSDDSRRPRLVGAAQRKAARKYGVAFGPASTVLVGDTELDVAAALEGGALVIAVATGVRTAEQLRHAGAHAVLPDLVDTAGFVALLRALTGLELSSPGPDPIPGTGRGWPPS